MNEQFEYLKNYISSLPIKDRQPSIKTQREYIKEYTRMHVNNTVPEIQAVRRSSYYKYRAAWVYTNRLLSENYIEQIEIEEDIDVQADLICKLNACVDRLKMYPSNDIFIKNDEIPFKKDALQKSKSKKGQIVTLNKNWDTLMFEHLKKVDSKYLDAVCVLMVGARPVELMTGVKVEDHIDGLKFTIFGAKRHGGKYGQETRSFVVRAEDDQHYYHLKQKMTNGITELHIKIDSAKLLGEQIRRNSKIVLPNEDTYISPYTYRHNFSRLLKGAGLSIEQVATALGHCTDKSMSYYSHKSGKSFFRISEITGTKKIKKVVNNSYINKSATSAPRI